MTAIKNAIIGAGIVAGFLIVSEMDYRDAKAQEQERIADMESACQRQSKVLVQDASGRYSCAHSIMLSQPLVQR